MIASIRGTTIPYVIPDVIEPKLAIRAIEGDEMNTKVWRWVKHWFGPLSEEEIAEVQMW